MKRISCFFLVILVLIAVTGCNPNTHSDAYDVMFEKQPQLIDDGVYLKGNRIGTVVSNNQDTVPIGQLGVSIDSSFQELMRTNVVFYKSSGKLQLATVGGYGEPLTKETKILGFGSKASLAWFKTRYLLKNQAVVAAKKAAKLHQRATTH